MEVAEAVEAVDDAVEENRDTCAVPPDWMTLGETLHAVLIC